MGLRFCFMTEASLVFLHCMRNVWEGFLSMSTCEKGESENGRGGRTCPGIPVYFSSHCSEGGGGIKQGEEVLGNQDYKSQDI